MTRLRPNQLCRRRSLPRVSLSCPRGGGSGSHEAPPCLSLHLPASSEGRGERAGGGELRQLCRGARSSGLWSPPAPPLLLLLQQGHRPGGGCSLHLLLLLLPLLLLLLPSTPPALRGVVSPDLPPTVGPSLLPASPASLLQGPAASPLPGDTPNCFSTPHPLSSPFWG